MTLRPLVEHSEVVVVVGSGGVGKTSVSAALGLAAADLGRRACVVTVDPARRLADAMGGADLEATPRQLETGGPGEFWALMLDPKETFDQLVRAESSSAEQANDILANGFYQRLSTSLPGVHEFMAVEQLHQLAADARFDVVIVDTPPSHHVLDLLDAPERLSRFLDNRLYRTLIRPATGVARLAAAPARAFTKRVASAVGGRVLDDAIGFFEAFAGMEAGFVRRANDVATQLRGDRTSFVVVTTPRPDAVATALLMADELPSRDLELGGAVVNMATFDPWPLLEPLAANAPQADEVQLRLAALRARHQRRADEETAVEPLIERVREHSTVDRRATEIVDLQGLQGIAADVLEVAGSLRPPRG